MNKEKDFLEFVTKNPPLYVPGDDIYYFNPETGKIEKDTTSVFSIALDENWNWQIIDHAASNELITPNEDPFFCTTFENAKKFRDHFSDIKYAILKPSKSGLIVDRETEKTYMHFKTKTLSIKTMQDEDSYISTVLRNDSEVKTGMIIKFCVEGKEISPSYLILRNMKYNNSVWLDYFDKKGKRILEDLFD